MTIKDGGPAFPGFDELVAFQNPQGETGFDAKGWDGMSLRDWFAGQALVGIIANQNATADIWRQYAGTSGITTPEQAVARACYLTADAMLAEREKKTNK